MRIVVISPFKPGPIYERHENIARAKAICRAIIFAGHVPFAPHLFFPQFLDDDNREEWKMGIEGGQELMIHGRFDRAWYYPGRGETPKEVVITEGMQSDMDAARAAGVKVERGTIGGDL